MGTCSRCLLPISVAALAAAASLLSAVPSAAATVTSCQQVDHWGEFFGGGRQGEVGLVKVPTAMTIPDPAACVIQVGTSNSDQYALMSDGTLWAWGVGLQGELGNGHKSSSFTAPVQVAFPPGTVITSIPTDANPYDSALAVDASGNLWGWGLNAKGELCLGNKVMQPVPAQVPGVTAVTSIAGANGHTIFTGSWQGTAGVWACGSNFYNMLGSPGPSSVTPVAVPVPAGQQPVSVFSAYDNAGFLTASGAVFDWGYNAAGQVGDGTTAVPSGPVQVSLPDPSPVVQVAEGGSAGTNGQTLVMLQDGSLYGWGDNTWGQLGNGSTVTALSPVAFAAPSGVTFSQLASGGGTSYAIDTRGNVWAWGDGAQWQIGDGANHAVNLAPVHVDSVAVPGLVSSTANDVAVAG